jgi:hypothetical protein
MKALFIIAATAILAVATPAHAATTATKPALVAGATRFYARDVASTVKVDGRATITLTHVAYRHPERLQATVTATTAGTYTIRDRCKPTTLPHTWIVYVNGVKVASTTGLKCE